MRYFTKFDDYELKRIKDLTDLQWHLLGKNIHLIASACYPFASVLKSLAEPSFVFPAEGMPGARYLPGSTVMDTVEAEGEQLVLATFSNPSGYRATLQPHSGTQANQIVYNAVLEPDDTVLCMQPRDGGHISHTVLIGRRNRTINFGLKPDGTIDYDQMRELAKRERPKLIIVGGSALPRQLDFKVCGDIARECGAKLHADISHTATFVAAGLHHAPFPDCDFVTFNTVKNLRGPNGGVLIYRTGVQREIHRAIFPTSQGGANETNMLGKYATFLEWQNRDIRAYADSIVGHSRTMAEAFQRTGIKLTTDGTDCHLLLLELAGHPQTGAQIERGLEGSGILVNKNLIPGDVRSPLATSGIRIGTANLAILNYSLDDSKLLAQWIGSYLHDEVTDTDLLPHLLATYHQHHRWVAD